MSHFDLYEYLCTYYDYRYINNIKIIYYEEIF